MADDDFNLTHVFIAYIKTVAGGTKEAFKIDGRDYKDGAAMDRDLKEARHELTNRLLGAYWDTRSTRQAGPLSWLPGWQQFKAEFLRKQDRP
jgi:hypothetical protein